MKGEWRDVALEDVADELTVGYVGPMASEYVGEGVPFLRSLNVDRLQINRNDLKFITPDFHSKIRKSRLTPGDVVIVRTGKPGTCSVVPEWLKEANCSDLVIVRCGPQLDHRFLAYYVNTVACDHVAAHLVGAVQQHFNVGSARTLRLKLPPLAEQKAIAAVLGALDDKIELNRQMNATMESMARALFQSWFVDFDPVRAKMEGRLPAGMDDATAALFPEHFEDSELGEIPRGWEVVTLGSVLDTLETGRRPKGGVSGYSFGVPSVGAESINGIGVFDFSKTKFIPAEFYGRTASGRVKNLDVLLYKDGGKPGEFRPRVGLFGYGFPFHEFCINEHVFRMRAQAVGQHYLYFAVSDERVLLDFANKGGKAAIPGINQTDVRSAQILKPSEAVLARFEILVQPICRSIIERFAESRTLAILRDTLLPKMLSGELSLAGTVASL
jgi:type I restriction enzyme S subunit